MQLDGHRISGPSIQTQVYLQTIGHHVARLRALQAHSAPQTIVESAQAAHRAICEAIARRQAEKAARLMAAHIAIARDRIVPLLASTSSDEIKADSLRPGKAGSRVDARHNALRPEMTSVGG